MKQAASRRALANLEASEATRARLKEAAISLLASKQQPDVRIADIVEAANLARGTFYLHFSDREAIMRAIALDFLDGLHRALSELPTAGQSGAARIEQVMRCYVDHIFEHQDVARAAFQLADTDPEVRTAFWGFLTSWAGRATRALGRAASAQNRTEDSERLALILLCMIEGVFQRILRNDPASHPSWAFDRDQLVQDFTLIWSRTLLHSA